MKIISSISCEQFTNYLEGNKLIADCQSGFRKKHSCTTAILKLTEEFQRYIANGKCIILVLLDFSNAYGSVDHDRLLQVLKSVGVTNKSMMWFTSFLHQWKQITKHDGNESKPCTIRRGIIQGENNSQALFSIFINNILKYISNCKSVLFADDLQIYLECDPNEIHAGIAKINDDMHGIEKFCVDYGVDLNSKKSLAIIISSKANLHRLRYCEMPKMKVNGQEIEYVDHVRDLGYELNRTIANDNHTKNIQQKVYGVINTINPLKKLLPNKIKLQLYKTLILPLFDNMASDPHEL